MYYAGRVSYLSVRNLPIDVERAIEREAKKRNSTKTEVVISALRSVFSEPVKNSPVRRDVRSFFGKMSKRELSAFQKATHAFGTIDEADWK